MPSTVLFEIRAASKAARILRTQERMRLVEVMCSEAATPEAKDIDSISSSSVCRPDGAARLRSTVVSL